MSTYEPIASQTLGSAAASVTFSSIPQGYTDIRVVVATAVNTSTFMRFNSDSGANYSLTEMWAGTSPISERATNNTRIDLRNSSSTLGNNMATVDIMSYSNSTTFKTLLTAIRDGLYDRVYRQVQLWRNTSAITTITFTPDSGTFPSGSTFSLYGIQVGIASQKAQGGNIVTSDGTYVYHTFTSSGSFIPNSAISADLLVVAGGGGGGYNLSGGGGAGGYLTFTSQSLTAKAYTVIVGAGGSGSTIVGTSYNGSNSIFGSLTAAIGGGGGRGNPSYSGLAGGSGGGGGAENGGAGGAGGTGTAGQGNNGGSGYAAGIDGGGGGGGGAGAAGSNGTSPNGGAGGIGLFTAISGGATTGQGQLSGGNYYFAGGGSGGTQRTATSTAGGIGGGGAGGTSSSATGIAGTANTGGGGGGSGNSGLGTNSGGSGIVIIRYAI